MRYISTRGEAPPASFTDVLLAGLARDGGLYVPETWPQFSAREIAGFRGKSYADMAVEVDDSDTPVDVGCDTADVRVSD